MDHAFGVGSREAHSAVSLHVTGQLGECLSHSLSTAYATECEPKSLQACGLQKCSMGTLTLLLPRGATPWHFD